MREVKDTQRSTVRLSYDGKVHKTFRGPQAEERFENEVRVLQYLGGKACPFVPELVSADADSLYMVTTNCGARAEDSISETRTRELFQELEDQKSSLSSERPRTALGMSWTMAAAPMFRKPSAVDMIAANRPAKTTPASNGCAYA